MTTPPATRQPRARYAAASLVSQPTAAAAATPRTRTAPAKLQANTFKRALVYTKALLKVFAWSFAGAVLVLGVAAAAAVGWLTREAAAYLALGCLVAGGVVIGRRFSQALMQQQPRKDRPAHPSAPDRGGAA